MLISAYTIILILKLGITGGNTFEMLLKQKHRNISQIPLNLTDEYSAGMRHNTILSREVCVISCVSLISKLFSIV